MDSNGRGLSWIVPPSPRSRSESQVELIVRTHTPPISTHDEQPRHTPHSLTRHRYSSRPQNNEPCSSDNVDGNVMTGVSGEIAHRLERFCRSLESTTGATHILWCAPYIWRTLFVPWGTWIRCIDMYSWIPWCYHMIQYGGLVLLADSVYDRNQRNHEISTESIIHSRVNNVWWFGIMMLLYVNHSSIQIVRLPLSYSCVGSVWIWILSIMDTIPGVSSIVLSESTSKRVQNDDVLEAYFIVGISLIVSFGYMFPLVYQCIFQPDDRNNHVRFHRVRVQFLIWTYAIYIGIEKLIYSYKNNANNEQTLTLHVHHWFIGWCLLWTHQWDSSIMIRLLHVISYYTFLHGAVVYQFDSLLEYNTSSIKN